MSTLYIDRKNLSMQIENQALVFREEGNRINTVPLAVLERVCIKGDIQLSASVLGKLGEQSVGILVLSGRNQAPAIMLPNWKLDGRRRVAQYQLTQSEKHCLKIARCLITEKINNQIQLLESTNQDYPQSQPYRHDSLQSLKKLSQQSQTTDSIDTLRGIEGAAAARYFSAWPSFLPATLEFSGRNRRPPRDPLNAILSLGYTLLHFESVKQIYLCGLDPFIVIYHQAEHGRESLACDLLEPLRPLYDQWAIQQFTQQLLSPKDFTTNEHNGCRLSKKARLDFYRNYEQQAKQWRIIIRSQCYRLLKYLAAISRQPDLASDELFIPIENPIEQSEPA